MERFSAEPLERRPSLTSSPEGAEEREKAMPQSLSSIYIHLVFSTKNRQPYINDRIEPELYSYIGGIFRNKGCPVLIIGGDKDHVHALSFLSRTSTVAELVEKVKSYSSKWIKEQGNEFKNFQWQSGYGVFSIGRSGVDNVTRYIANQKLHHRGSSYQDEFRSLCRKYELDIDERYVWD